MIVGTEFKHVLVNNPMWLRKGFVQGSFDFVHQHATRLERMILTLMREDRDTKNLTAKVRCNWVEEGEYPCAHPDWHYDLVADSSVQPVDENHRIWVSSIPVEFEDGLIPAHTIFAYGRDLHRATKATESGLRLFVRVSESKTKKLGNYKENR